jgi:hypothetical protein
MAAIAASGMKNRKNEKCCVNEKPHTRESDEKRKKRERKADRPRGRGIWRLK